DKLQLAGEMWAGGIATEYTPNAAPSLKKQMNNALESGAQVVVTIGEKELAMEPPQVNVKVLAAHTEVLCPRSEVVATVAGLLKK
ncbi:hypothetical protein KIPB_014534, partial [Kipferlia bialata]